MKKNIHITKEIVFLCAYFVEKKEEIAARQILSIEYITLGVFDVGNAEGWFCFQEKSNKFSGVRYERYNIKTDELELYNILQSKYIIYRANILYIE